MVPLFGAHLLLAAVVARALRGSVAAALACCRVIGNPLTHLVVVPLAFALGHLLLPVPPAPGEDWLPPWIAQAFPLGEEALAGGVVLGAAAQRGRCFGWCGGCWRGAAGRAEPALDGQAGSA